MKNSQKIQEGDKVKVTLKNFKTLNSSICQSDGTVHSFIGVAKNVSKGTAFIDGGKKFQCVSPFYGEDQGFPVVKVEKI